MSKGKGRKSTNPPAPEAPSARYRFFLWAIAFLSAAQLLVGLDYITLWPGAEATQVWAALQDSAGGGLPALIMESIPLSSEYWLLAFRLPSLLAYVMALGLFWMWAPKLFGREVTQLTLLVIAASFMLPIMAKQATLDAWRLGPELGCWLALMYYFKSPTQKWLVRAGGLGVLAVIAGGYSTLVLLLVWQIAYYRLLTPKQEGLKVALTKPFIIAYLGFAVHFGIAWVTGGMPTPSDYFSFGFPGLGQYKFLGYALLGMLPFIGFTLAALRDLYYKMKRGEELAW